jgi:hypothetical protein
MDGRYRYVVPELTKQDDIAEVKLFGNALTLLCWGLVLINFRIGFQGLELALYDYDGTTYSQVPLNKDNIARSAHQSPSTYFSSIISSTETVALMQLQYRLLPNCANQRGYVAVSAAAVEPIDFVGLLTYIHQESLWNRPHLDMLILATPWGNTMESAAFRSEVFYVAY